MVKTLKKKLISFLSTNPSAFYFGCIFYIVVFVIAAIGFLGGIPSAWSLLTMGKLDSYAGVWTLMAVTFFGRISLQTILIRQAKLAV